MEGGRDYIVFWDWVVGQDEEIIDVGLNWATCGVYQWFSERLYVKVNLAVLLSSHYARVPMAQLNIKQH